jgi:vitamin B12 transporter
MDQAPPPATYSSEIVVTAARTPQEAAQTPAAVTIIDQPRLERLGEPQIAGFLRLVPSAAVSTSGPMGSITEVRIRGAEANHTLLFIDGIRANDPAESNTPRFELLNPDIASRIEVVRGPQSALWGSEAIGGVIAVEGRAGAKPIAFVEAGSLSFVRAGGSLGVAKPTFDASLGGALQRSRGINNYAGVEDGERDGFRNLALRGRVSWRPAAGLELTGSAFALSGRSDYDGYDPVTLNRADTLDFTRNRLSAGRLLASYDPAGAWKASAWVSRLQSSNRNFLDDTALNRTRGRRDSAGGQVETHFMTGAVRHELIAAAEVDRERFAARDFTGGFTNQDRSRNHFGLTAEWRASVKDRLFTDLAVRNDRFNRFKDTTTVRASLLVNPVAPVELGISYGEGIAQPTFTELYGFFPGGFTGNPDLRPERSRSLEVTARFRRERFSAALSVYRHKLSDEIVTLFSPVNTAANLDRRSDRIGAEAELHWHHSDGLRLSATYAYLDATQPVGLDGDARELRRPRHSGSIAADGVRGAWNYGLSLAYTGAHLDQRDEFPYDLVRLDSYWLAGARVAYTVRPGVELFARAANAFDTRYQDVVGYRTEGRSLYAGIRLADRR